MYVKMKFICRVCKSEYDENGKGINGHNLQNGINPSGLPLLLCGACGNVVDLYPIPDDTTGAFDDSIIGSLP